MIKKLSDCKLIIIIFFSVIVKRNKRGENNLYVSKLSPHFQSVQKLYKKESSPDDEKSISFDGMSGTISSSECNVLLEGYVLNEYKS